MSNPNGAAGRRWANAVVQLLHELAFLLADRKVLHGTKDRGDIAGVEDVTIECKGGRARDEHGRQVIDWSGAVDEAALEAVHNGTRYFVAAIKRRRRTAGGGYAVTTLANYFAMVRELLGLRARVAQLEMVVRALGGSPDEQAQSVDRAG